MTPSSAPTRDHLYITRGASLDGWLAETLIDLACLATIAAAIAAAVVLLGYAVVCAVWPYGICRRCHGASRLVTRRGRTVRRCRRCRGSGLRLRLGRRLYNHVSRFRHARANERRRRELLYSSPARRDDRFRTGSP